MSGEKRIAIVAFSAPPHSAGGVASAHFNLFKALRRNNYAVRLFTFGDAADAQEGEDIVRSDSPNWWRVLARFILKWLFKLLRAGKRAYQLFDIIAALPGALQMNRKIKQFQPEIVILSDHGAPGLFLKKRKGSKVVLVSHHNPARFLAYPAPENYSALDARLALALEQRVLRKVDTVICPSNYMKDYFQRSYRFDGPIHVIPNIAEMSMGDGSSGAEIHRILKMEKGTPIVYLPSVGSYLKGAEFAGEIISGLREIYKGRVAFYLPGSIEDTYLDELQGLAARGDIFLADQVSYAKHINYVKQCSFCVAPSLMENYSMALLEATLLGLPILAFETGGNADIVQNGRNGFLVPIGDVQQLGDYASKWKNAKALRKFQKAAKAYSQKKLDPQIAIDAYMQVLNSL